MGVAVSGLKSESLECLVSRPSKLLRLIEDKSNKFAPTVTREKRQLMRLPTWAVSLMNSSLHCVCEGTLQVGCATLVFQSSHESTVSVYTWPLWSLRWYGSSSDYFVFEAGRRCPSGPGQFLFRCKHAKKLRQFVEKRISKLAQPLEFNANADLSRTSSQSKKDASALEHSDSGPHSVDSGAHHGKVGWSDWFQTMRATANDCPEHEERYTSFSLNSSLERYRPGRRADSHSEAVGKASVDSRHPTSPPAQQPSSTTTENNNNVDYLQLLSPSALTSGASVTHRCCLAAESTTSPVPPPVCYPQLIFSPAAAESMSATSSVSLSSSSSALSGGQYLIAVASPHAYINQPGEVTLQQSPAGPVPPRQLHPQEEQAGETTGRREPALFRALPRAVSNVYVGENNLCL